MKKEKYWYLKKWWFWVIIAFVLLLGSCMNTDTTNTSNTTNQVAAEKVVFLKKSNGKEFYQILCDVAGMEYKNPMESEDTIDYINGSIDYGISMCTNKNNEICYISIMAFNNDYENFFLSISRLEYENSDKSQIFNWIHDNLGKEATTKIGDANFKLYLGTNNKPVLEVFTDGNDEFQKKQI